LESIGGIEGIASVNRAHRLHLIVAATALAAWAPEARAQAAPNSRFNRTTSATPDGARTPARRGPAADRAGADRPLGADPLAPYTDLPRGGYRSPEAPRPPAPRPTPPPASRNYFPTARFGQARHICTPSRAGVHGNRR